MLNPHFPESNRKPRNEAVARLGAPVVANEGMSLETGKSATYACIRVGTTNTVCVCVTRVEYGGHSGRDARWHGH